jgi:hypothetical protein
MDAMLMSASIRSLRSMNHTNLNAQYAKTVCERSTKQHRQSSKQKDSIPQADRLLVFDFFAGTGSSTKAFEDAGHTVIKVELDTQFEAHERDIMNLSADYLIKTYGQPDFIWASPPCTSFSIAAISHHRNPDGTPKSKAAIHGDALLFKTLALIEELNPKDWVMENPRGMMRKHPVMINRPKRTVTYCAYNDNRMKPTDLWGSVEGWVSRPMCSNGDKCHEAAPRGSRTGTQGLKNSALRSMVPYELSKEILDAITTRRYEQGV